MGIEVPLDFSNFELEITNRCNLECPRCSRTDLISRFPKSFHNTDLSLDAFVKFIEPVIDHIDVFEFKGTMGDPIFHPEFIKWITWAKSIGKNVFIHTNAQAGKKIWLSLSNLLTQDDKVIIGIDGLPENFAQYRVNAKWDNIDDAIGILRHKTYVVWQYIVFKYNENDIETARELSRDYGFDEFLVVNSNRWEPNDYLKPTVAPDRPSETVEELDPQCLTNPMHIVTADGYYMPCCMLIDHRYRYKTPWAKAFNISDYTIKDVIMSKTATDFFEKLDNDNAPNYCKFNCGKCVNGN